MGLLIDLDIPSLSAISHNASQVMVYGFGHCKYLQIIYTLQNTPSTINTVFECSIGNSYNFPNYSLEDKYRTTSEGRLIHQFQPEPLDKIQDENLQSEKFCTRVCKAGAIDLVYENFLRKKEGLPIIPFIFVLDIANNPYSYNPANFASRDPVNNSLVTHAELRRCYKLANEFPCQMIRDIANEMFKFVKLNIKDDKYYLEQMKPFWLEKSWQDAWKERKRSSNPHRLFVNKSTSWVEQLLDAINKVSEQPSVNKK